MGIGYTNRKQSAELAIDLDSPGDPAFSDYVAYLCRGVLPLDTSHGGPMGNEPDALAQLPLDLRPLRVKLGRSAAVAVLTTGMAVTILTQQSALADEAAPLGLSGHSPSGRQASVTLQIPKNSTSTNPDIALTEVGQDTTSTVLHASKNTELQPLENPLQRLAHWSAATARSRFPGSDETLDSSYALAAATDKGTLQMSDDTVLSENANFVVAPRDTTVASDILAPLVEYLPQFGKDISAFKKAVGRALSIPDAAADEPVHTAQIQSINFQGAPVAKYATEFIAAPNSSSSSIDFASAPVVDYSRPLSGQKVAQKSSKQPGRAKKHVVAPAPPTPVSGPNGIDATYPEEGTPDYETRRAMYIANYYVVSDGLTDAQGAGIAGNAIVEALTTLKPEQRQLGGGPGMGLFQWGIGGRWDDEESYALRHNLNPTAADTELAYADYEMHHGYSSTLKALRRAQTPGEAAIAFEEGFEKAGAPALKKRADEAKGVYRELEQARAVAHTEST